VDKWHFTDFPRVLWFHLPIRIPPIAPQSSSSSSIIWGCYIDQTVAAVPSGLSLTPWENNNKKKPFVFVVHSKLAWAVKLLIRILGIPSSKFCRSTDTIPSFFIDFPKSRQAHAAIVSVIIPRPFPPTPFPNHSLSSCCSKRITYYSVVKYK
jgi:hypothetical protein